MSTILGVAAGREYAARFIVQAHDMPRAFGIPGMIHRHVELG